MRNYLSTALYTALAVCLSACEKDINVKIPDTNPRLVISSTIIGQQMPFIVQVGRSIGILKENAAADLNVYDAEVSLYDNGIFAEELTLAPGGYYQSNRLAVLGHTYTIKVKAPGFANEAEATAFLPSTVPVAATLRELVGAGENGVQMDELTVRLTDPAGTRDYYRLSLWEEQTGGASPIGSCLTITDPSVDDLTNDGNCHSSSGVYLRDELFDGKEKVIRILVPHDDLNAPPDPSGNKFTYRLQLEHLSSVHYTFLQSFYYARENDGNPFSEPVNLFTNVKNGYGIFAITNLTSVKIK